MAGVGEQLHPHALVQVMEIYRAKAMLLGMYYDPSDHTLSLRMSIRDMRDADTMEPVSAFSYYDRMKGITDGSIGPAEFRGTQPFQRIAAWRVATQTGE